MIKALSNIFFFIIAVLVCMVRTLRERQKERESDREREKERERESKKERGGL